jgi:tetratricopeptide (TPR) repeat protein
MTSRFPTILLLASITLCVGGLSGCATHARRVSSIRDSFYAGQIDNALAKVERAIARDDTDVDALKLDRAIIELASGRPADAERTLREVRDRFDYLEQKDASEAVISALTDDNKLAYAGEDYEKVLIRCFLALSSLMHNGQDAGAYALQVGQKQQQIIDAGRDESGENSKLAYKRVAFGAYLHASLREPFPTRYDEAASSIRKVANWEPEFPFIEEDVERITGGVHSKPGNGVLYVIALVGRGPYKEERFEVPTSNALLIADRILSATSKHSLPPTIAPIRVPIVVRHRNAVAGIDVSVDGKYRDRTETITDIGQMAVDQYAAVLPKVMARAVVRRVVKKGAIYATKEFGNVDDPLASLALDAVGVAWEATETADTRCWGLLPDHIDVLRLELPAGEHSIELEPVTSARSSGTRVRGKSIGRSVTIQDGQNTFLLATVPDLEPVGEILVSGQ